MQVAAPIPVEADVRTNNRHRARGWRRRGRAIVSSRSWAGTAFTVLAVLVVAALVFGQLLGQPILLGYVTTGSMEPTIGAGDGFVVIPSAVAGEPEHGDVIVFDAREIEGGGLTTHRVVGETDEGYITRGDANPFTDQDAGEPPVTDGQVVAHALEVGNHVVVIPNFGTAIMAIQGFVGDAGERLGSPLAPETIGTVLVVVGLLMLGFAALVGDRGVRDLHRSPHRQNVVSVWLMILVAVLVVTGLTTAAMVLPAGTHEYGIVSADESGDEPGVIEAGGSEQVAYEIDNAGVVPVLVVLEPASEGVEVYPEAVTVDRGETATKTVVLSAPEERGEHFRHVAEHRYLVVLPPSVLLSLHAVSPAFTLLAINAIVGGIVVAISVALFGTGHLRMRSPGSNVPPIVRIRRKLRRR